MSDEKKESLWKKYYDGKEVLIQLRGEYVALDPNALVPVKTEQGQLMTSPFLRGEMEVEDDAEGRPTLFMLIHVGTTDKDQKVYMRVRVHQQMIAFCSTPEIASTIIT